MSRYRDVVCFAVGVVLGAFVALTAVEVNRMASQTFTPDAASLDNLANCGCAGALWPGGISGSPSGDGVVDDDDTVDVDCCVTPIKKNLVATFVNISGCAALDGGKIPITWTLGSDAPDDDDGWKSAGYQAEQYVELTDEATECATSWRMVLTCTGDGTNCSDDWTLQIFEQDGNCQVVNLFTAKAGCSCGPLTLEFGDMGAQNELCECCEDASGDWKVVITEAP